MHNVHTSSFMNTIRRLVRLDKALAPHDFGMTGEGHTQALGDRRFSSQNGVCKICTYYKNYPTKRLDGFLFAKLRKKLLSILAFADESGIIKLIL